MLLLYRSDNSYFIHYFIHSGFCFDSSVTSVTNLIYSWLKDDLQTIGWIE